MSRWIVTKETDWHYCDNCKGETEQPVLELCYEGRTAKAWHYRCRPCALKRVKQADIDAAIAEQDADLARKRAEAKARWADGPLARKPRAKRAENRAEDVPVGAAP